MIWLADILCLSVIAVAIGMGVRVVLICRARLIEFDISDIHAWLACDKSLKEHAPFWAWVFPLTMGFLLLSLMAFIARLSWALDVGWDTSGHTWATVWLIWHTFAALLISVYHYGIIRIFRTYYKDTFDA